MAGEEGVVAPEATPEATPTEGGELVQPEETPGLPSDTVEFEVPDKFAGKSIEDVIKSYQELEKMKGGGQESTEGEAPLPEPEVNETVTEVQQEQYQQYADSLDKNGSLSDAEYAELAKAGYDKATVDKEIVDRADRLEFNKYKANKTLDDVLDPLGGGQEKFRQVADWANNSKDKAEVAEFNAALKAAPKMAQQAMLRGLYAEFESSADAGDTVLHTNSSQRAGSKGYTNESEMFKDMNSPSYLSDPKYNKAVMDKLAISDTTGWSF